MAVLARSLDTQFRLLEAVSRPIQATPPQVVESGGEAIRNLRASLEASIASKLSSGSELVRAVARQRREEILPTTIEPLDALLGGGLARGKMTEIAGRGSRFSIVMATLASATSIGEAAALIDAGDSFDPQLAEAAGVELKRLLWVRPHTMKESVAAAEAIGATGFQLVIIDMGARRPPGKRVPDATWVRLARVAESHGATILISAPYALTGTTSEAMLLAYAARARWLGGGNAPRVLAGIETKLKLEKHRRLRPGQTTTVFFQCEEAIRGSRESGVGSRRVQEVFSDTRLPASDTRKAASRSVQGLFSDTQLPTPDTRKAS
jgi:hypothetical protein